MNIYFKVTFTIGTVSSIEAITTMVNVTLKYIFKVAFAQYSGWMPYYVPAKIFVEVPLLGIVSYAVIAFILTRRVKKVPLDEALKNVE